MGIYAERAKRAGIKGVGEYLDIKMIDSRIVPEKYLSQHDLIQKEPSPSWIYGYPLGNGDMGAMLYGHPGALSFHINKSDVWDLRSKTGKSNFGRIKYKDLRKAIADQDWDTVKKVQIQMYQDRWDYAPSFQPCGILTLNLIGDHPDANYQQRLSLHNAEANISFNPCGWLEQSAKTHIELSAFVTAISNVLAIRINFNCGSPLPYATWANYDIHPLFSLELTRQWSAFLPEPTLEAKDRTLLLNMKFPQQKTEYSMACGIEGAKVKVGSFGRVGRAELTPEDNQVDIFLTISSNADGPKPSASALKLLQDARKTGYQKLRNHHRRWWRGFWNKSFISIEDKKIESQWYFGIYCLGSCSAPGKEAPGLQGLWSNQNAPSWHGDYTADLNIQMNHWSCYATNHIEQSEPLYRLYREQMWKQMKKDARDYYGMHGIKVPCSGNPAGSERGGMLAGIVWPATTPWIALHFWWAYQYTLDKKFLKEHAYPFLIETISFYEDWLTVGSDGKYQLFPTFAPEQHGDDPPRTTWGKNSTIDTALLKKFLEALLEASNILGKDAERCKKWQHILDNLPPYPTDGGHLIDLEGRDFRKTHRHLSRATPIYPAGDIGLGSSSEQFILAQNTYNDIVRLCQRGGDVMSFTPVWESCLAARLGLGEDVLRLCHEYIDEYTLEENRINLLFGKKNLTKYPIMQIESTLAFPAGITESLLQSHDGIIRLFPAVPKRATATFNSLRAVGGFLVSSRMEGGDIKDLIIKSTCGGMLRLSNPFGPVEVIVNDLSGKGIVFRKNMKKRDNLCMSTEKEHVYRIARF